MTTLLDTSGLTGKARTDYFTSALLELQGPMTVHIEEPERIEAKIDAWALGSLPVMSIQSTTGFYGERTKREAEHVEPVFAIGLQLGGTGRIQQFDTEAKSGFGSIKCLDAADAFESCGWMGAGTQLTLAVSAQQLALPASVIRKGATQIKESHLQPLVTRHLLELANMPPPDEQVGQALGAATIELLRALLASAAHMDEVERDVLQETLLTRIRSYIRQHLRDPDLSPASIAVAHHISVRYLYRVCSEAGFSLEQWIIAQRLDAAASELRDPEAARRSIGAIATQWGFRDPAHFSRRFRQAFGVTPREWRTSQESRKIEGTSFMRRTS